jgi:hypothetical protein
MGTMVFTTRGSSGVYHPKACREPGQRQRMEKMAKAERKGTRSGNDGTRQLLLGLLHLPNRR